MTAPTPLPDRSRAVLAVLVLAAFAYNGLETVLAPAVPLIQKAVGASTPAIAWVFTGVLLAGAVATPVVGRLADIRDKRRILLWVLAIVGVGTIVAALAKSVLVLAIGQLLQGAGLGLIPLSVGIIRDTQSPNRMKAGSGMLIGASALATAVGLLIAGSIVARMPYTWLFWFPLMLIGLAFVAAWFVVPSCPPRESGRLDWPGAVLLGLGLTGLLVAITESSSWGWTSGRFLGLVAASLVVLGVFAVVEVRTETPLVDLRMLGTRSVLLVCVVSFVVGFGSFTIFVLVPMLVQLPVSTGYGLGGSATLTGLSLVPLGLVGTLVAPLTGRLERAIGARAVMALGAALLTAANLALLGASQAWVLFLATALAGAGIGLALTQSMNIVLTTVPGERTASVSGMTFVIKAVGGALGAQVGAGMLAAGGAAVPAWSDFRTAFVVGAAVVVVAVLLSFALPARIETTAQDEMALA
ncbi:MFS transporter [Acrocarpospora pleiomorpha]|uniref:MFS transporter n=1 Tax=Acrocarpospora pleiomorpha TaxID=90975 RepID=A0A5M3XRV1_9ACTN|nr:MFS transporter [Acrocarpospora pleiomorpha]GES21108.1 MFS transporter [Acrocarpospora pleiomorpha]